MRQQTPLTLTHTYHSFLDSMRIEAGLAANTIDAYTRDGQALIRFLASQSISRPAQITRDHLLGYLQDLRSQGLASRTINRMTVSARIYLKYLFDSKIITDNPADALPTGRLDRVLPGVLAQTDIQRLLEAPQGDEPLAVRDRAILQCLYASGARVSEMCSLRESDVSLADGVIRLSGKGGKERLAPIGERAIATIRVYTEAARPSFLKGREPPWLLLSRTGKKLTRARVWQIVQHYGAQVGLPDWLCHPHTLRHCFATHLLENGADVRAVQVMLGHEDIETTQIYTHVDAKRLKTVVHNHHPRGRKTA